MSEAGEQRRDARQHIRTKIKGVVLITTPPLARSFVSWKWIEHILVWTWGYMILEDTQTQGLQVRIKPPRRQKHHRPVETDRVIYYNPVPDDKGYLTVYMKSYRTGWGLGQESVTIPNERFVDTDYVVFGDSIMSVSEDSFDGIET